MRDAVALPVTVKHRIGLDDGDDYGFVRDFVGTVAAAGCDVFIVHARNAVLKGLSPKENREVPPLRYEVVHRLKRDFPALTIVLNGGLDDWDAIERELRARRRRDAGPRRLSRSVCSSRRRMRGCSATTRRRARAPTCCTRSCPTRARSSRAGVPLRAIARHVLGLYHGRSGGRRFRQILSDAAKLHDAGPELFLEALAAVEPVGALPA